MQSEEPSTENPWWDESHISKFFEVPGVVLARIVTWEIGRRDIGDCAVVDSNNLPFVSKWQSRLDRYINNLASVRLFGRYGLWRHGRYWLWRHDGAQFFVLHDVSICGKKLFLFRVSRYSQQNLVVNGV